LFDDNREFFIIFEYPERDFFTPKKLRFLTMIKKEIRQDLYTQTEYAKKIGKSVAWVNKLIKEQRVHTVTVNGATLIKL